jgi:hypothetical protein
MFSTPLDVLTDSKASAMRRGGGLACRSLPTR